MTTKSKFDTSDSVNRWSAFGAQVRAKLSKRLGFPIEQTEFQAAYEESRGLKELEFLYTEIPDVDETVDRLTDYPWEHSGTTLETVTLKEGEEAIPEVIPELLLEKYIKVGGEKWVIHKNDADPFPSNPHGHNYARKVKLNLTNGLLYRKRIQVSIISKKSLLVIREQCKHPLPPCTI